MDNNMTLQNSAIFSQPETFMDKIVKNNIVIDDDLITYSDMSQPKFIINYNILGTAEVAAILDCPKQQIYTLRKRVDFPKPITEVAATPLWDADDIRAFKTTWVRRAKREANA